jgi:glycosyltransferase involved in cell wall biosynthesis
VHILFFEPEIDGHPASYVNALSRYISRHRPDLRATFAIDPGLLERLDAEAQTLFNGDRDGAVVALPLSATDLRACRHPGLARRGLRHWSVAKRIAQETCVDHCCFLQIDLVTLPLMLGKRMPRHVSVSGVLFRPNTHYREVYGAAREPREMLRATKKALLYRGALRNPCLIRLFTVDPYFPAYAEHHYHARGRMRTLPEPVFFSPATAPSAMPSLPDSTVNRVLFLLFGHLSARKGVETVLQAARLLERRIQRACAIVFAGSIDPMIRDRFLNAYREVGVVCPDLALHLEDRYLTEPDCAGFVRRADVVLAPYHRHNSNSSVLFWAAAAGKPVITQDYGLLQKLTQDFGLGITVDTRDPTALAAAMTHAVEAGPSTICRSEGQQALCSGHTADDFARTIVEGIAGEPEQE